MTTPNGLPAAAGRGWLVAVILAVVIAIGLAAVGLSMNWGSAALSSATTSAPPDEDASEPADEAPQSDATAADPSEPPKAPPIDDEMDEDDNPYLRRIPAPELDGGVEWINTAGPLTLKDLKGKFVVLDFWTYCCINCMHVLPELKKLEQTFPNELVVIGVHSAKFEGETDSQNIRDAVLRYGIEHPVVNDANHTIWDRYGVRSWPTMLVIDPEGQAIYGRSGEFKAEEIDAVIRRGLDFYRRKGVLDETPLRFDLERFAAEETPLRFPGKILADEKGGRLFISDNNHNRIVITSLDGKLLDVIGSGAIGSADGGYAECSFNKPQGMALTGDTLYVADTENHLLRKVDLAAKAVKTIAGRGQQARLAWPGLDDEKVDEKGAIIIPDRYVAKPLETDLNSPWALLIEGDALYIAMAGPHQIWRMPLDESEIGPYAGNGREDIVDGPLLPHEPYEEGYSSFAQPSGLASDGTWLYVADSEGSSIRAVPFDPSSDVRTLVGTAELPFARLFTFGDVDGQGSQVRLQHPLDVAYVGDTLYVADTYNNKIKSVNPQSGEVRTIAGTGESGASDELPTFDEPEGLATAGGKLYVADTNNHRIRVIDLGAENPVSTLAIEGLEPPKLAGGGDAPAAPEKPAIKLEQTEVRPVDGQIRLAVSIGLPAGFKINGEAPMRYKVTAAGDTGAVDRGAIGKNVDLADPKATFEIRLPAKATSEADTLTVALTYFYCREGAEGYCKVGHAQWEVPVVVSDGAKADAIELTVTAEAEQTAAK